MIDSIHACDGFAWWCICLLQTRVGPRPLNSIHDWLRCSSCSTTVLCQPFCWHLPGGVPLTDTHEAKEQKSRDRHKRIGCGLLPDTPNSLEPWDPATEVALIACEEYYIWGVWNLTATGIKRQWSPKSSGHAPPHDLLKSDVACTCYLFIHDISPDTCIMWMVEIMCICVYIYIYIHTHTHTYIHVCVYTYIYIYM